MLAEAHRLCKQNGALRIILVHLIIIVFVAKVNQVYHLAHVNVDQ
jgi:hypothetical protein